MGVPAPNNTAASNAAWTPRFRTANTTATSVSGAGEPALHDLDLRALAVLDGLSELDGVGVLAVVNLVLNHGDGTLWCLIMPLEEQLLTGRPLRRVELLHLFRDQRPFGVPEMLVGLGRVVGNERLVPGRQEAG